MSETKLKQLNLTTGKFVLINPSSIASIEQQPIGVRITMKEISKGESIYYDVNYNLDTLLLIFKDYV